MLIVQEMLIFQSKGQTFCLKQHLNSDVNFAGGPQEADIGAAGPREGGGAAEVGAVLCEVGVEVGAGGGQVEADRGAAREGEGDQRPRNHAQVI